MAARIAGLAWLVVALFLLFFDLVAASVGVAVLIPFAFWAAMAGGIGVALLSGKGGRRVLLSSLVPSVASALVGIASFLGSSPDLRMGPLMVSIAAIFVGAETALALLGIAQPRRLP